MRIALFIERFDASHGGAETYATRLAQSLDAKGHTVEVLCRQASEATGPIPVRVLTRPGGRSARIRAFAQNCADVARQGNYDATLGLGRTLGQDVLMPRAGTVRASREGTLRSLGTLTGIARRVEWTFGPAARTILKIERRQFEDPNVLCIVNSSMVATDVRRDYPQVSERVRVIPTGVDTERFSPQGRARLRDASREMLGLRPDMPAFLFAGHNFRLKGLKPLLKACALLDRRVRRPFRLLVAGGDRNKRFVRRAQRVDGGGWVDFLGPTSDMTALYAAADAVVHPTFYDPGSNVVLEACACGLPVVMSRWDGSAELAGEETDWVLNDPGDVIGLSDRMERLLKDGERERLGRKLRVAATGRTLAGHVERVMEVLTEIRTRKEKV